MVHTGLATSEQLLEDSEIARRLLAAGHTRAEVLDRLVATGISEEQADVILRLAQVRQSSHGRVARKAKLVFAFLLFVVLALFGGGALLFQHLASQDSPKIAQLHETANSVCPDRPPVMGRDVMGLMFNGEPTLYVGDSISIEGLSDTNSDQFADLMWEGEQLKSGQALCVSRTDGRSVTCDGYYSSDALAALEEHGSVEAASAVLLQAGKTATAEELLTGGRTVQAIGVVVSVSLVSIPNGAEQGSARGEFDPQCRDWQATSGSLSESSRASVTAEDVAQLLAQL